MFENTIDLPADIPDGVFHDGAVVEPVDVNTCPAVPKDGVAPKPKAVLKTSEPVPLGTSEILMLVSEPWAIILTGLPVFEPNIDT
jgi:hypothetical protein